MEHPGACDAVAHFAGGGIADDFAQALAAQEKERVAYFLFGVIEALPVSHFADVRRRDGDFFAAVKLQQTFVSDFV